jgi:hypothetical protein
MSEILKWANDSKASEVVILLDCCFSGALGNPPAIDNAKALLREGISILTASRAINHPLKLEAEDCLRPWWLMPSRAVLRMCWGR